MMSLYKIIDVYMMKNKLHPKHNKTGYFVVIFLYNAFPIRWIHCKSFGLSIKNRLMRRGNIIYKVLVSIKIVSDFYP